MTILQIIQTVDESVFQLINQTIENSLFDFILPWFRNKFIWIPLYIFLIAKTILHYKEYAYVILLSGVLSVSIADHVASGILKPLTERVRPCNNDDLTNVRIKAPCRHSFSFVSSHAANHFAIAFFFFTLLGIKKKNLWKLLFIWAALICLAQVYVGLHYPSDVIIGGVIGVLIAWGMSKLLTKYYIKVFNVKYVE